MASPKQVLKAVIPAAGFGTRMFPGTKVIKKEFFPIIDAQGRAKPVILAIVEEAMSAGVQEVGIVVGERDRKLFEDFFHHPPHPEFFRKLKPAQQEYCQYLQNLGTKVTLLTQDEPEGFGHAVYCAQDWVGNDPFLLLLGDTIYTSTTAKSCAQQLVEIYQQVGQSVIGVGVTPASEIANYGCISGTWQTENILRVSQIDEKPSPEYARHHLQVEGMAKGQFLCVFGIYILTAQIFTHLAANINGNNRERGEFQLTSCLETLQQEEGMSAYLVQGKCFDIGLPLAYQQTVKDFR